MKKDEILSMAKQAGIDAWWESGSEWRETFDEHIERFAALVAEKEREACAKVAEQTPKLTAYGANMAVQDYIANAIRERGQK